MCVCAHVVCVNAVYVHVVSVCVGVCGECGLCTSAGVSRECVQYVVVVIGLIRVQEMYGHVHSN